MTKKKMAIEIGLANPEKIVGFMQVKNFDGVTMHVDPKYLKELLFALTSFDKKRGDVQIGISDSFGAAGAFFIFLDDKCEMAIGVAGHTEE